MPYSAGPTSIRLEQDDVDRIQRLASKQGIGQASVIRIALRLGLGELEQLLEHPPAKKSTTSRKV
jgi:predicted DNA-binding protein